jgi:hypothetical protein
MKYPVVARSKMADLAPRRLAGEPMDMTAAITWSGDGDVFDPAPIAALAVELENRRTAFQSSAEHADRDLFEGAAAADLHSTIAGYPLLVLDDPGFWRYLALEYFWGIICWREAGAFAGADYGKYRKYIDGVNPSECVLIRMFIRAQIALEDGDYALATAIPRGTDFWRSHILRVRTSSAPIVSRAFAREQARSRMGTSEVRAFARRLNRLRTNVVLDVYDRTESEALLTELRGS